MKPLNPSIPLALKPPVAFRRLRCVHDDGGATAGAEKRLTLNPEVHGAGSGPGLFP